MQWQHIEGCDVCGSEHCAFCLQPDGTVRRLCTDSELQTMVTAYLECALWSSTDISDDGEMGEPLDASYSADDIAGESLASAVADCDSFRETQADDLADMDPEQAGHDFWLTRNGHGAGFWDRGLGARGDRLSKACKPYGSVDLYVGDDGKVYGF